MPTTSEIAIFQREHPAAALWCMDEINRQTELFNREFLDVELRNWVLNQISDARLHSPSEPARMYEALHIPNGDYAVTLDGVDHQFRVWLVQQGQLAGTRIVKHRGTDGRFRGFAFITRDGNLRVWTRFASQATSAHALAFERVVTSLTEETFEGVFYSIRRRCPICNNYVTDEESQEEAHNGSHVALCGNHAHMRDSHTGDGYLSQPRRSVSTATPRFIDDDDEMVEPAPSPTRARRLVTPRVLMCENGTGMVR